MAKPRRGKSPKKDKKASKKKKPAFKITLRKLGKLDETLKAPEKKKILTQIAKIMVRQTKLAFTDEGLPGLQKWKRRYPNQEPPFINIAGALRDFRKGLKNPKKRRFEARPVLRDSGNLRMWWKETNNKAWQYKGKYTVVIASGGRSRRYAAIQQYGLISKLKVTSFAKTLIADAKRRASKAKRGARKKFGDSMEGKIAYANAKQKSDALSKLGFLINKKTTILRTKVVARPFLGMTEQTRKDIRDLIEGKVPGK